METTESQLFREIRSCINKLQGIELLEYEDKNFLTGDNGSRAEEKIEMLTCLQGYVSTLQHMHDNREKGRGQ